MEKRRKSLKIIAIAIAAITILGILVKGIYSANNNHYVVDVVKESAENQNSDLRINEKIVKDAGKDYFDSKKLNYEVEVKNIIYENENIQNQIAIVVDTSYSMEINDPNNLAKSTAKSLVSGIYSNIANAKVLLANNAGVKVQFSTSSALNTINNTIDGLKYGEGSDCNDGLQYAYDKFSTGNNVKKYLILFTDATDDCKEKMQTLMANDSNLQIITILVDMTSTSYVNENNKPIVGDVFMLYSDAEANTNEQLLVFDLQKIYDEINKTLNQVTVINEFSETILKYFDISSYTVTSGQVEKNKKTIDDKEEDVGYKWVIDKLKMGETAKLTYSLTIKSNVDIDAGVIFNEIKTNETQKVIYKSIENEKELNASDSTLIKICYGYDLKIKAVNEANADLGVSGISMKVEATNENEEVIFTIEKTTDNDGYITITPDDSTALRSDGVISYRISPTINQVGYIDTDPIVFEVNNNKITRNLSFDNYNSNLSGVIDEEHRTITVTMPINVDRVNFELKTEELGNSNVTISDCEFELIQPKLNNNYEMEVLSGKTDSTGRLYFAPTVMTKDGTYNYILRQVSSPSSYDVTNLTLIEITFKNGKVTKIDKQFNQYVKTEVCEDENHVLVTVQEECLDEDPFNLQINLIDSTDGSPLEGASYSITTVNSNNISRTQYVSTDGNGQINANVYGAGNLMIKIIEQSPKAGYVADTKTKTINLIRNNGVVTLYDMKDLSYNQNADQTDIVLNFTSTPKTEQNVVKVTLVDSDEQDITIGRGVVYKLTDTETGKTSTEVSDKNGEIRFVVDNKTQGDHRFTLEVDKDSVPAEYDENLIADSIAFNLTFDETECLSGESVIDTSNILSERYSKVTNDTTLEYTAYITIGYELEQTNIHDFRIKLVDKEESSVLLEGATYNIDIEWEKEGEIKTRSIVGRKTNSSGEIITRLVSADRVSLSITETSAVAGYHCDNTTEEVVLASTDTQTPQILSQSPYEYQKDGMGVYNNSGTFIYIHKNRERTVEDTYLNLTVTKSDTDGLYKEGVRLKLKSNTLLDKNNNPLDIILTTDSNGTATIDYQQYINDLTNNITTSDCIKVAGIGKESDEIVYQLSIIEEKQKLNPETNEIEWIEKEDTEVRLRLIFRNKDGNITLTNVETIYGNRLVKNKVFSSASSTSAGQTIQDSLGVFLANVSLDLYYNYDSVGNLALNFNKVNKDGTELNGAEYDIKITNPDGIISRRNITVENGDLSSAIELQGLYVQEGSVIEILETTAPLGYDVNEYTETLLVKSITDAGEVILEQINQAYEVNRLSLEEQSVEITSSNTLKTMYNVTLTDLEKATSIGEFKFGISTVESTTLVGSKDFKYQLVSDNGYQKIVTTDDNGKGETTVGGLTSTQVIKYTIKQIDTPEGYEKLVAPIDVYVHFDLSGYVDYDATINGQTDALFNKYWTIKNIGSSNIEIQILSGKFTLGITTIDTTSLEGANGFTFQATGSNNVQKNISTTNNGYGSANMGRSIGTTQIKYTITTLETAKYFVVMTTPIEINVYFDNLGKVIYDSTINGQTDKNYGSLWTIDTCTANNINIKILEKHLDKLKVKVETIDTITEAQITTAVYTVPQSVTIAQGTTEIDVGYVVENGTENYSLDAVSIQSSYTKADSKTFKLEYVNEKIVTSSAQFTSSNSKDSMTVTGDKEVTIKIYVEPNTPFEFTNLYYFDQTQKLQGGTFNVQSLKTSTKTSGFTDSDGKSGIYNSPLGTDEEIIYRVSQSVAATGYATIEDFYVKVGYDSDRKIISAILTDEAGETITNNNFVTVGVTSTSTYMSDNGNGKGFVTISVLNYPRFDIKITNVDKRDSTTPLAGTTYDVTSTYEVNGNTVNFTSSTGRITNNDGLAIAELDRTRPTTVVTYTIVEKIPATGYQTLGKTPKIQVTFDNDGRMTAYKLIDENNLSSTITVSALTNDSDPTNQFVINVIIKNNPLVKFNITTEDSADSTIKVNENRFTIVGAKEDGTVCATSSATNKVNTSGNAQSSSETGSLGIDGYTYLYLDKTLENTNIYYTIKQIKKNDNYQWLDSDIILKVTYDSNGQIVGNSGIAVNQGSTFTSVTYDSHNFEINVNIANEEVKDFGIHLSVEDAYDSDKKISDVAVEAYLTDPESTGYITDSTYELVGDNALLSGADRDGNGTPDVNYGKDYLSMGQYTDTEHLSRTLRLTIKNKSNGTYYYKYGSETDRLSYYKNAQYVDGGYYQVPKYNDILVSLNFNDEGKIVSYSLISGNISGIGWVLDSQYVTVKQSGKYKLNITLKLYPMFALDVHAMNNYTGKKALDNNKNPDALDGAKYTISTRRYEEYTRKDEFINVGYIGYGEWFGGVYAPYGYGITEGYMYSSNNSEIIIPIENNSVRTLYVYEDLEPTNYQQYRAQYFTRYKDRLVGIIQIRYNEKGEFDVEFSGYKNISWGDRFINDTTFIKVNTNEEGNYTSNSTIKDYNYGGILKDKTNRSMDFYIGYGLTTTITVTAKDDISGNKLSNIYMYPCLGGQAVYKYMANNYGTTNNAGQYSMKYWGASTANLESNYIIGSSRASDSTNGYIFPNDMTDSTIGGSGAASDYYTKLEIEYDENGFIKNITSVGKDLWGDSTTGDITWDEETGHIYIDMVYSRKFQFKLLKEDYYDTTINNLVATFKLISNKGVSLTAHSGTMVVTGKVYKDTTVKYTLTETQVPNGYYPMGTLEYYVTFDKNGNVSTNRVVSNSSYFEAISTSETTERIIKSSPDLVVGIKNKAAFNLSLQLIDKFYNNEQLSDVYFEISNSKGDTATGNPQTDANGHINTVVGVAYPGEKVEYYITQSTQVTGYYENNAKIVLTVEFNNAGTIQDYSITSGSELINNFKGNAYKNTRSISLQITNMPKDIKLGVYKYDKATGSAMENIEFAVTKENLDTGVAKTENITTTSEGIAIMTLDTFDTSLAGKKIEYTIDETNVPDSYRKMEDSVFDLYYDNDGKISSVVKVQNASKVTVATANDLLTFHDQKVHIIDQVSNDNAFDIIIKNTDTNYSGLGINGSKFDISVNGTKHSATTNDEGEAKVEGINLTGNIEINIAQREAGEGYKDNIDNAISVSLDKGTVNYTLELNSTSEGYESGTTAVTTNATVTVDELKGTVTVTFENETESSIKLIKRDVTTKEALENVEFEITEQQIDSSGNAIGNENVLTTEDNKLTDKNGELILDLGVTPQSEIWKYTFKEVVPPEGYGPIIDLSVTVVYDQYGRIQSKTSSRSSRLTVVSEHNDVNCHEIDAIIYNGDIAPAYTIKVITKDSENGNRINDSKIYMEVTDAETNDLVTIVKGSNAAMDNRSSAYTSNLGIDDKKYSDADIKNGKAPAIMERGLVYIDNITFEGRVNIQISEDEAPNGYKFGSHKTGGNIQLEATHVPHLDDDPTIEFNVINNDGMDIAVDETNRVVTITIENDSYVNMDIVTQEYGTQKAIQGVNYEVTAEIETASSSNLSTDLNETTALSDENGKTKADLEEAYSAKSIIYTVHQKNIKDPYYNIDDIKILVQYDTKGYIKYIELLSSEDNATIVEDETKDRNISIIVQNRKNIGSYTVYLEKHAEDTEEDLNAYGKTLQGAKYQITVNQENSGSASTTWTGITDEKGMIRGFSFDGSGYITITVEELLAPDGYKVDVTRFIRLYRDKDTGEFVEVDSNVNYDNSKDLDGDGNNDIIVQPIDQQADGKFTLNINKYSTETGELITSGQAKFKVEIQKEKEDGTRITNITTYLYTNSLGKASMDNLDIPNEEGQYKLVVTEAEAPTGYAKLKQSVELDLLLVKDTSGNVILSTVSSDAEHNITATATKQLITLTIGNDVRYDIEDDEYMLNITKVDSETKQAIKENKAIFELTYPDGSKEYLETDEENGKLKMPTFEMPDADSYAETTSEKYTLQEIKAPNGYLLDETLIEIEVTFGKDSEGAAVILYTTITKGDDVQTIDNGVEIPKEEPEEPSDDDDTGETINPDTPPEDTANGETPEDATTDTQEDKSESKEASDGSTEETTAEKDYSSRIVSFNIENTEGTIVDDKDRGTYTINISKIDATSKEPITARTTFAITLENGEKVSASTDENGQMQIKDIKIPSTVVKNLGPYKYTIEEISAPEGYEVMTQAATMEITFKAQVDSETGLKTGYYEIDTANITSDNEEVSISGYDESKVNLVIENDTGEEKLYIKTSAYIMSNKENYNEDRNVVDQEYTDGDTYIYGMLPQIGSIRAEKNEGTTLDKIMKNIDTNADEVKVLAKDNQELAETDLVGTNMKLVFKKGSTTVTLTIIVTGDIDGNGILNGSDKTNASNYINMDDYSKFDTDEKKLALDVNLDGKIQPSDLSILKQALAQDDNRGMGVSK